MPLVLNLPKIRRLQFFKFETSHFLKNWLVGEQIGQIFAQCFSQWGIVGLLLKNYRISPHFWLIIHYSTVYFMHYVIVTNRLAYIFGDFFTNSSGHHGFGLLVSLSTEMNLLYLCTYLHMYFLEYNTLKLGPERARSFTN
jgi:hypothetical protein